MNEKISIIVPVYNVEKYLKCCIDSLINQTYKNIEILLIDDGSTDNSGKICDQYTKIDNRIKVFHKKNGGLYSARNVGLKEAKGEYLSFVDSDDYVSESYIQVLYDNLKKYDCDISMCFRHIFYEDDKNGEPNRVSKTTIYDNNQLDLLFSLKSSHSFCMKLFKKDIFKNIRFLPVKKAEDSYLMFDVLMQKPKIVFDEIENYYYLERKTGLTKTINITQLDYIKAYQHWIEVSEEKLGINSSIYYKSCIGLLDCIISNVPLVYKEMTKEDYNYYVNLFKKYHKTIKVKSMKKKIKYFLFENFRFIILIIKGRK